MAAPVVQSQANSGWLYETDPVVTKPTGLAEGDLMIAHVITAHAKSGSAVSAPNTPSGWTLLESHDQGSNIGRLRVFGKIATAGDVAASNFTFTITTKTETNCFGSILRITGASPTTTTAIYASSKTTDTDNNTTVASGTISLNTFIPDALLLMLIWGYNGAGGVSTVSGYTVSGTNPSWTEQFDQSRADDRDALAALASSSVTTPRVLTSAQATLSNAQSDMFITLSVVPPATPITVTPNSIAVNVVIPTQLPQAKVTVSPDSLALRIAQSAPTATIDETTDWVNEAEATTTWVNEE